MHQSKETDFATVADLTTGHLPLSPLVFSSGAAYQPERSTKFHPLQEPGYNVLYSTLLQHVQVSGKSGMLTMFHVGSSNPIFLYNFHTVIFLSPSIFLH